MYVNLAFHRIFFFSCFYGFVNINYYTVVKISYTTIIGYFKYTVWCNKYSDKFIFCYIFYANQIF